MTTVHHAPHAFGAGLTSAEVNRPLGELDAAIERVIATGSGASTTLTAQASSGSVGPFSVASTTGLLVGDSVFFGDPGGTNESRVIATVPSGTTFTTTTALANTYAIGKPVSKSPIEVAAARAGFTTLGGHLDAKIGGVVARGTGTTQGLFGITDTPVKRIPVNIGIPIAAAGVIGVGTENVIGLNVHPRFTGDFTGIGGTDPGFVWGVNVFTQIGPGAPDGDGLVEATAMLVEMALTTPSAAITTVRAFHVDAGFFGAGAGGAVTTFEAMRVSPPRRKEGAIAGTATNTYGIFVEAPSAIGTSGNFAIFTAGGPSRFTGLLEVENVLQSFSGWLQLQAAAAVANGPYLLLDGNAVGLGTGAARFVFSKVGAGLEVHDGTNVKTSFPREGGMVGREIAEPAAPAADHGITYYRDNGAGKTQLVVKFNTGAVVVIATQP